MFSCVYERKKLKHRPLKTSPQTQQCPLDLLFWNRYFSGEKFKEVRSFQEATQTSYENNKDTPIYEPKEFL